MKILITNDDGIHGSGLRPLFDILDKKKDKIVIVVPDRERSAVSQAITLHSPIRMKKVNTDIYTIDGTPTDCVYLTVLGALNFKPDIVISGINNGYNLGEDIVYSGTVAAAIEASLAGIKSFAVSMDARNGDIHFETGARIAELFLRIIKKLKVPRGYFFNINLPNLPYDKLKGIKVTHLGSRQYIDRLIKRKDPQGHKYFWLQSHDIKWQKKKQTDFYEVHKGFVSITPLYLDMTAYGFIEKLDKEIRKI